MYKIFKEKIKIKNSELKKYQKPNKNNIIEQKKIRKNR